MPAKKIKDVLASIDAPGIVPVNDKVREIRVVVSHGEPVKKTRAKRILSDEQKDVLRARLVKARETRVAKKADVQPKV